MDEINGDDSRSNVSILSSIFTAIVYIETILQEISKMI